MMDSEVEHLVVVRAFWGLLILLLYIGFPVFLLIIYSVEARITGCEVNLGFFVHFGLHNKSVVRRVFARFFQLPRVFSAPFGEQLVVVCSSGAHACGSDFEVPQVIRVLPVRTSLTVAHNKNNKLKINESFQYWMTTMAPLCSSRPRPSAFSILIC